MTFLHELWVPILVSAAVCFVASAVIWMAMPHHKNEWRRLPTELDVLAALRKSPPPPGLYRFPFADASEMNRPDVMVAMAQGPIGSMAIRPNGVRSMGPMLAQSFVFYLVTSLLAAYVAWNSLGLGAAYAPVFRIVGTVTTMAYTLATVPESIWFGRPWKSWFLGLCDGLAMGLLTAGVFGWLWPQ